MVDRNPRFDKHAGIADFSVQFRNKLLRRCVHIHNCFVDIPASFEGSTRYPGIHNNGNGYNAKSQTNFSSYFKSHG